MITFTIGSGKNGTHAIDAIARSAGVISMHEPLPHMGCEEALYYEGRMDAKRLRGGWESWRRLKDGIAANGDHPVHIADNKLTMLSYQLAQEFPLAGFIIPIRHDIISCAASLYAHGCYTETSLFAYPRQAEIRLVFDKMHPLAKCVWLVRTKNRAAMQLTDGHRRLVLVSEEIDANIAEIAKFVGGDPEKALAAPRGRPGATDQERKSYAMDLGTDARVKAEIDMIREGKLDEGFLL